MEVHVHHFGIMKVSFKSNKDKLNVRRVTEKQNASMFSNRKVALNAEISGKDEHNMQMQSRGAILT